MGLRRVIGVLVLVWSGAAAAGEPVIGPRITSFLGIEGAFDGAHLSSGFDVTLGGQVDRRGFVARLTGGSGVSRFRIDPVLPDRVGEITQTGRLLAGWREAGAWGEVRLLAGLALEHRRLSPALPDRHLGLAIGPAVALDAWLTPHPAVAVQVHAAYTTAMQAWTVRVAPGLAVGEGLFTGPEASLSGHHGTLRTRLGWHLTGLRLGPLGLRVSGGWAFDRGGRNGAYGGIALWRNH
ncbi:cellulose biosynthesis protein BcsS [Phreatobacter sp.]|uniref:cellulose biosynthesis protein BcsS n=1 Tax=Phreatobacter sp. TaxID=1966341 RepID=UPI003F6F52A2